MIAILVLGLALSLGLLISRTSANLLSPPERIYLLLTPLPAVLSLVLPAIIGLARAAVPGPSPWSIRLTVAGACLSAAMLVVGTVLGMKRSRHGLALEPRLAAGLLLATLPLLLVGTIIAARYAIR